MENKLTFKICEYQSSSLDFSQQSCCPEDYHILSYLENVISSNLTLTKNNISRFFKNKKPKVRLLAVKLYLKLYGYDNSIRFTVVDPFYRIRLYSIPNIKFSELLKMVEDENVSVKQAVLEEIMNRDVTLNKKKHLFSYVGKCIVHPNFNVRLITAKLLHIFQGLELSLMNQLLSKNDDEIKTKSMCGLIIYGLEDEYAEVRESTINSLYVLSDETNIHKTFSYFVDSLNDESFAVRRLAISCIKKLSARYKIIVNIETIKQICFLMKEENEEITKIIVSVLHNLKFNEIEVLLEIIENIYLKLTREDILCVLISQFRNNAEIIIENIERFYRYSPFLEQQIALTDTKYFCNLLVISLCVFNKIPFKLDRNTKKHIDFITQEILISPNASLSNLIDFTKDSLAKYIESGGKLKNFEKKLRKSKGPAFIGFAVKMIYFIQKHKKNKSLIRKINYHFTNINITNEILNDDTAMVCFIYDLNFEIIMEITNTVKLINRFNLEIGSTVKLVFEVVTPFKNAFLVIENDQKKRLSYLVEPTLRVSFYDDNSTFFKYFLAIKDNNDEFVIGDINTIQRSKDFFK